MVEGSRFAIEFTSVIHRNLQFFYFRDNSKETKETKHINHIYVQTELSNNDLIHYNDVGVNTDLAIAPATEVRSMSVWNGNHDERYDYFDRISYNRNGSIQNIQRNIRQSRQ
jgi:hypothetical protein